MRGWGLQPWGKHQWGRPWAELRITLFGSVHLMATVYAQLHGQVRLQIPHTAKLDGAVKLRNRPHRATLLSSNTPVGKVKSWP